MTESTKANKLLYVIAIVLGTLLMLTLPYFLRRAADNLRGRAADLEQKASTNARWPLPPLIDGNWESTDEGRARTLRDELIERAPDASRDAARVISAFRLLALPCYTDAYLGEGLTNGPTGQPSIFTFLMGKDSELVLLDGTAIPIADFNQKNNLHLDTKQQAESYLRLYSAAVSGKLGTFRLVDTVEELDWFPNTSENDRRQAANYVRPLVITKAESGNWKASATVQFGSSIYNAVYSIEINSDPPGHVEMPEDFPLVNGLPLRTVAFNGPLRFQLGPQK